MAVNDSPHLWQVPVWHPDYGDPKLELNHLRTFAETLLKHSPEYTVALEAPEPGMIYVEVTGGCSTNAEIYSVPSDTDETTRQYGIFISPETSKEIEAYMESPDEAAKFVIQLVSN